MAPFANSIEPRSFAIAASCGDTMAPTPPTSPACVRACVRACGRAGAPTVKETAT
eukprot:COSAG01_NODE_22937_length_835_cov_1.449728_2_plen_54_part_01